MPVAAQGANHGCHQCPRCPICTASETVFFCAGRDRLFGAVPGTFRIHRCRCCGSIFQDPIPDQALLDACYPEQYWWGSDMQGNPGRNSIAARLERIYREFVVSDHVRFLCRCARERRPGQQPSLLDIGCGSGAFLNVARKKGFVACGMDSSARAVRAAEDQYGLVVKCGSIGSKIWNERRFDFITMFHVLEHLPDPRKGLEYADHLLKPGGTLMIQVPNVSSFQARIFRGSWYGLDVPRHVINFTPRALKFLLAQTGFDVIGKARFSLRDNPASLASSLAPVLDPVGRSVRFGRESSLARLAMEMAYMGLVLFALPLTVLESALGFGGTIWVYAKRAAEKS